MLDLELQSASVDGLRLEDVPEILEIQRITNLSPWSAQDYAEVICSEDYRCLALRVEPKVVGFINTRLIRAEHSLEIMNIAVLPELQNSGLGQKLLGETLNFSRDNNIEVIFLEVRRSNLPALKFYRKKGFTVVGERRDFYRAPAEDALLMRLEVEKA